MIEWVWRLDNAVDKVMAEAPGNSTRRPDPPRLSAWITGVEATDRIVDGEPSWLVPCRQFGRDQTIHQVQSAAADGGNPR